MVIAPRSDAPQHLDEGSIEERTRRAPTSAPAFLGDGAVVLGTGAYEGADPPPPDR